MYGIRRLLITGDERLTDRGPRRIHGLRAGDRDDEVWYAWIVKELLRSVYRAANDVDEREPLIDF